MSEIKKLIERLCPDGVEYRKLVDLAEVGTGSSNKQDSSDDGKYPFFVRSKFIERHNDYEYDEEAIIIPGEGGIGDIFHYINGKYALHQRVYRIHFITNSVNAKFAYYYLRNSFKKYILGKAVSATVTSIRKPMIQNFEIPVPPLEVQTKIVEILDNFTELEAELEAKLEAELEARRKQYEYYRNQLLTFDKVGGARFDVKWMKMSDIGTFTRGKRFVRTDIVEDGVPCIHYGDMYTYYGLKADKAKTHLTPEKAQKMRFAKKNDVVIVGAGENKRDIGVGVAWLGEEDVAVHDACYIFSSDLYPQYVSHFLRTEFYHKQIYPLVSEGKICSISAQSIGRAIIPIPPLDEQKRIVSILDRFEALTTDLQSGLPAEIEARRKQYEYYREQLLTFKRKTT